MSSYIFPDINKFPFLKGQKMQQTTHQGNNVINLPRLAINKFALRRYQLSAHAQMPYWWKKMRSKWLLAQKEI